MYPSIPAKNKAVNSLGISAGTISTILNGKFDNISDEMFLRIRSQISPVNPEEWTVCETTAYRNYFFAGGCASESKRVMGGRKCRYRQDDDRARLCCQA